MFCRSGRENLCTRARFTGCDIDGGMAEYTVADERFCFPIGDGYPAAQAAPLLCAGLIGYRALRMCGDAEALGLYGFGAAAHILTQVALAQGRRVYAFVRPGDSTAQAFALRLGADLGGRVGRRAARAAGGRDRLRARRRARPDRARGARSRRDARARRHPHERHPVVSVRAAVA